MGDTDYSQLRSIADEPHWNDFVQRSGGELVAPLIKRQGVKNADYMFRASKIIAELKILETEFAHTPEALTKVAAAYSRHTSEGGRSERALVADLLSILRAPLQRIIKKANRQIKETKQELGLVGWRGIMILVNHDYRGVPPGLLHDICGAILGGESYNSIDAFIYQTNHYVELPDNPYANLLWAPMYSPKTGDALVSFVNDLGRRWRAYSQEIEGPYDFEGESKFVDLDQARVVTGPNRFLPYLDEE